MPTSLDANYFEGLFRGSRLAIVACKADGRIIGWNAAAENLFENLVAGCEGQQVEGLFPVRDRLAVMTHLKTCVKTREPVDFRLEIGGTEADPIVYATWWTPVLQPDGSMHGVALWFRDITQRVRLKHAVEKRQRLSVLGSLAGAVAHHYNNLLCGIVTSLEYASNMNTTTAMRRALQRTADAVTRAAEITGQLLVFAQADHRARAYSDLTEAVLYFFDENEERLRQKHIKLRLDWHRVPICPVPREQIIVVISNLVQNAIEVMPNGGTLTVTIAHRDATHVSLSITDTGPGIEPGVIEHLFEPFFTTKGVLASGPSRNAGMGLAVVHGFVSELGGYISAGNLPGAGARFEVVLPIKRQD